MGPTKYRPIVTMSLLLLAACAPKRVAAPPPAPQPLKQNVVVLLAERDGSAGSVEVRNSAGAQVLDQANLAVRVERADVAPGAPFRMDDAEVKRVFGSALDVLPEPEILFVLHFDGDRDVLNAESLAQVPAVLNAIRQRRSTSITVLGHTDTTSTHEYNYQLGLRRAQNVANILRSQGVNENDLFVSSHGDADLLVKTGPNTPEAQNRRVEVIVR